MSVGNATQAVQFDRKDLTLVLGQNLDLGGDDTGARNGTGKTTIINALSYALYGSALTNIKKDNLINITNQKDMLVVFEFEKNSTKYKIERGRKPAIFKFYVNNKEIGGKADKNETNDALGENADSQKEIDKIIGMDATMFRHLVALNTFTNPFLSMPAKDQRDIIEKLLGITLLSEKADLLRKQISLTDDKIKEEEYKIKAIDEANQQIEKSIKDLERRQKIWENNKTKAIEKRAVHNKAKILPFRLPISNLSLKIINKPININIEEITIFLVIFSL